MTVTTKKEVRFMRVLRRLEREQIRPDYVTLAKRLGFSSIGTVYDYLEQLERKGYITKGKRLALVECQVVTTAGLELLGEAA